MRCAAILAFSLLSGCTTVQPSGHSRLPEVGVAFDANAEIDSYATGLADPRSARAVTADDPVRIASISKLVVAIGVMKLVEHGKLSLDQDVSTYLGWKLRNPRFPGQPITLRMLMSHTSSIRDRDDQYAIPLGGTVQAVMAQPGSWDPTHAPRDHHFAYSNLNFPILGSIVEKMTRERFDLWMRREMLDPLKVDACFNWPTCSDAAVARAVVLYQKGEPVRDDLHGKRPDCPVFVRDGTPCDLSQWRLGENGALFAPQGGLRISMRGLARVGRMLLNRGTLDGVRLLSPNSVDLMLSPQWRFNGHNGSRAGESASMCSYGLAAQQIPTPVRGCRDDLGTKGAMLVGHSGDAYGLQAGLWIDRARRRGIAYFTTGVADDAARGPGTAFSAAEQRAFQRSYRMLPR